MTASALTVTRLTVMPTSPVTKPLAIASTRSGPTPGNHPTGRRRTRAARTPYRRTITAAATSATPATAPSATAALSQSTGGRRRRDDEQRDEDDHVERSLEHDRREHLRAGEPGPAAEREDARELAGPGWKDRAEEVADELRAEYGGESRP